MAFPFTRGQRVYIPATVIHTHGDTDRDDPTRCSVSVQLADGQGLQTNIGNVEGLAMLSVQSAELAGTGEAIKLDETGEPYQKGDTGETEGGSGETDGDTGEPAQKDLDGPPADKAVTAPETAKEKKERLAREKAEREAKG